MRNLETILEKKIFCSVLSLTTTYSRLSLIRIPREKNLFELQELKKAAQIRIIGLSQLKMEL